MAFERNDIVNKTRLAGELGEELMGFEHNDIVTVDVMNKAIEEGGGGGGTYNTCSVTVVSTNNAGFTLNCDNFCNFVSESGFDYQIYAPDGESVTHTLLYIGDSATLTPYTTVTEVEGDAEYDSDTGNVNIWGDCTITGWTND